MENNRIINHPILDSPDSVTVFFTWNGIVLQGQSHDTIASALIANGIHIFGHHIKDGSPQGLFCANGQCSQCTVLVNGNARKACMTPLADNMMIEAMDHLPEINGTEHFSAKNIKPNQSIKKQVLIIGAGPAGLSAAITLGHSGVDTLLVDDKQNLGGKLVLQTHRFFGSVQEVYAGKRGFEIAKILSDEIQKLPSVKVWSGANAVGVFSDHQVGIVDRSENYHLIHPDILLIATGARENTLAFPGNTLPGVYGAGAFQTLINRDLVKPAKKLFIVGGGNVGLITGYHALQAGVEVIGLIEAAAKCGGYQVHENKLSRLGVTILTSHTIISANGNNHVESITIAECDAAFKPIEGTEKTYACDAILIAVGLSPVNEFALKAKFFGMTVFSTGDAEEIAEASAAMISGKIKANLISQILGISLQDDLKKLSSLATQLRSRPGKIIKNDSIMEHPGLQPIIHCTQEIPCNPCSFSCPLNNISIPSGNILLTPIYNAKNQTCLNCERCLIICPGLAITIMDTRIDDKMARISIPYEFDDSKIDEKVTVTDRTGIPLQQARVISVKSAPWQNHTRVVKVEVPINIAQKVAGIRIQNTLTVLDDTEKADLITNDSIICRCERVSAGEIRNLIRNGVTDINQIKAITRAGMGACGSKTCHNLILSIFREEGIPLRKITQNTDRPIFVEVELGILAKGTEIEGTQTHD